MNYAVMCKPRVLEEGQLTLAKTGLRKIEKMRILAGGSLFAL